MKVAVAQIACRVGDIATNLESMQGWVRRARDADADLVVFPEMSDTGYVMDTIKRSATAWNAGAVPQLRQLARRFSIEIVCGVSERDGDTIYNSQVVVNKAGDLVAQYRKTHLFTPEPIREDTCFAPGQSLASFDTGDFRVGLAICYDLRFPEFFRRLALDHQVTLFVLSSAWPCPRAPHFRALATARAIENQACFVAANRVGSDGGVEFCGASIIIDQGGAILAAGSSDKEELIVADISAAELGAFRRALPVLEHRRTDLYA